MAGELVHYEMLKEAVRKLDDIRHELKEKVNKDPALAEKVGPIVDRMKKPCMALWAR